MTMMRARTPVTESNRLELARLYREFRDRRFPGSRGHKETDLIHTLIVQYDAEIALSADRLLTGLPVDPSGLREDDQIEHEVNRLVSNYSTASDIGRVAGNYADYYELIKKVLEAAKSYLDSLGINPV